MKFFYGMSIRKYFFHLSDKYNLLRKNVLFFINKLLFLISFISFCTIIYDIGFLFGTTRENILTPYYLFIIKIIAGLTFLRILLFNKNFKRFSLYIDIFVFFVLLLYFFHEPISRYLNTNIFSWIYYLHHKIVIFLVIFLLFTIEISKSSFHFLRLKFNPFVLFTGSFLLIIFIGTGLLLLPNSTTNGIRFIDAFFTSTSAVCVTGLTVVDTATQFTVVGKGIILALIQIGGLGIMTITSLFGFLFKDGSFQNHIFLKDFSNTEKLSEVFKTLKKIILVTLFIEIIGSIFIYYSVQGDVFFTGIDKIKFSVFHSVSAFCNAGFSTLTNGLYDNGVRFNYSLQTVICFLIILGGIGFSIIFNFYNYLKVNIKNRVRHFFNIRKYEHIPRLINVNTKIVVIITLILLAAGTILFFILEYNNTLREHNFAGKIIVSFFNSVTPRTAGFNNVDVSQFLYPTFMLFLLLMWIGGSPGSTAGGIKTTTFAIAVMNVLSIARGKDRVECYKREISNDSVRRAFTVIFVSILVLGTGIFLLTLFEKDKSLLSLVFESFSAFGTVGLSMGITSNLTDAGKIIITFLMFFGRVGMITLIMALIRRVATLNYRYPAESISIN